jgi:hypothetical protein
MEDDENGTVSYKGYILDSWLTIVELGRKVRYDLVYGPPYYHLG